MKAFVRAGLSIHVLVMADDGDDTVPICLRLQTIEFQCLHQPLKGVRRSLILRFVLTRENASILYRVFLTLL